VTITNAGGSAPGVGGSRVRTDQRITIYDGYSPDYSADGYLNPQVRYVSQQEIVLSGNSLKNLDVCMGPIVYPYSTNGGGGFDSNQFAPNVDLGNTQIYVHIKGGGSSTISNNGLNSTNGIYCKVIYSIQDSDLSYKVYLRNTNTLIP
jgi:hypothetical protein